MFFPLFPVPWRRIRRAVGERRLIRRNGRSIAYHVHGAGLRVAMLAAAGRPASDFNELAEALAEVGFRTLAQEAPGIGGSDMVRGPVSLYDLADDLHMVVGDDAARTGEDLTIGLGHGFGNRVVRAAASRHGENFVATILVGAGGERLSAEADRALRACFDVRRPFFVRRKRIQEGFFAGTNRLPHHWRGGWSVKAASVQGAATLLTSNTHWKRAGRGPVLALMGCEDRIAPMEHLVAEFSVLFGDRVTIRMIENAGHALLPEQPIAAASAIADFLRRR